MGVVVLDSGVVIGFLNRDDNQHEAAVRVMREAMAPGMRRLMSAVNYAEILVGPLRTGAQDQVERMFTQLSIEIIAVDRDLAQRAAAVRARTRVKLADAFALATVIHAEQRGGKDVRIASFDRKVLQAHAALHPGD